VGVWAQHLINLPFLSIGWQKINIFINLHPQRKYTQIWHCIKQNWQNVSLRKVGQSALLKEQGRRHKVTTTTTWFKNDAHFLSNISYLSREYHLSYLHTHFKKFSIIPIISFTSEPFFSFFVGYITQYDFCSFSLL
jgi:hypothetical protein